MKTLKFLCIALFVLSFSCSSDDDNNTPPVEMGSFPTKITKTSITDPTVNRSFNFTYNDDNQISNISIVFPEGEVYRNYVLSYNNNLITSIDDGNLEYAFGYSAENRLNSLTIANAVESITIPVNFNDVTNTYSLTLEGTVQFTVNEEETIPLIFATESTETTIGYTTMDGVFANVPMQIGLNMVFGGLQGLDYQYFHPFALQSMFQTNSSGSTEWNIINTRDANDNITTINANSLIESFNYTIEYEEREL